MLVRSKTSLVIGILLFVFTMNTAGQKPKECLRIQDNTAKKKFVTGDTIHFSLENLGQDTLLYDLEVMMYSPSLKEWIYSPFYTRYFNYELTYIKMCELFTTKLPVTFSQNYTSKSKVLLPTKIRMIEYIVKEDIGSKSLIRFRINASYGILDECKIVNSKSFYFVRIEGDDID